MRRNKPRSYPEGLCSFLAILWRQCENCKDEFRMERGWKYTHLVSGYWAGVKYLCKTCCQTKDEAADTIVLVENRRVQMTREAIVTHDYRGSTIPLPPPMRRGDGRSEPLIRR